VFELAQKTVLVTGGSRGIGAATVRAVAALGGRVLLHFGSNRVLAEAIQHDVGADKCVLIQSDLGELDGAERLWREAAAAVGRIDVLINNAAIFEAADIAMPLPEWRVVWNRVLQINLLAPAELCRFAIEHFRQFGGGKIINIASRAAHRGEAPDQWPYGASKGALVTLTKTIARGYAKENILAFAICPGFTETEMVTSALSPAELAKVVGDIPIGGMARPGECGALAAFLCCDQVRHMTGATFDINGASYVR